MTDYATLANVKTQVEIPATTVKYDTSLAFLITRASRAIDRYCGREDNWFVALATDAIRTYNGSGKMYQWIHECVSISLVEVKDSPTDTAYTAWVATDWKAFCGAPDNPNFNITPYTGLMIDAVDGTYDSFTSGRVSDIALPTVRVTAKWGYATTVPAQIEEATMIQTARWFKRAESSWADSIQRENLGRLGFVLTLDPDVKMLLDDGAWCDPRRHM